MTNTRIVENHNVQHHNKWKKYIMRFISFKVPFRLFAMMSIIFLVSATAIFTYRAAIEIFDFFQKNELAKNFLTHIIAWIMATLISAGTFAQSAPIIWDKFSYWGQIIDNYLLKWIFKKKYFLDEIEDLFSQVRKQINIANDLIFRCYQEIYMNKKNQELAIDILDKMDGHFKVQLHESYVVCKKIIFLLQKNEAYDAISNERKAKADNNLNEYIHQLAACYEKHFEIEQIIHNRIDAKK